MTYRDKDLLAVAHDIECVNCGAYLVQAAHANLSEFGKGMGKKASDAAIMSLCPRCHMELDQGKTMSKAERRQAQFEWIAKTLVRLVEAGKLRVVR